MAKADEDKFGVALARAVPGADPLETLAGMSLAARAVLVLRKKGARRITLVVDEGRADVGAAVEAALAARGGGVELTVGHDPAVAEGAELVERYDAIDGVSVTDAAGKARAFHALFEACRKSVDGIVSRHLNRHVSLFISRRIVDLPITPNQVSIITLSLGLLAAWFVQRGDYRSVLIGAFLLQWNSILDGVDGELARVRHQGSKLGQWVDTVSDDFTNIVFWASLGVGARHISTFGPYLFACGVAAAVSNFVVAVVYYQELIRIGSGDFYDISWNIPKDVENKTLKQKLFVFFAYVLKKDFFILFCLVLAVFGVLPFALPVLAAGGVGTMIAAISRGLRRALGKGTAKATS